MRVIGKLIVEKFFPSRTIDELWSSCPNHMLWEAINVKSATILHESDALQYLKDRSAVYILPEFLPMIYWGIEENLFNILDQDSIIQMEPLYIVSRDFSWMIVITTENACSNERLCVYMESNSTKTN